MFPEIDFFDFTNFFYAWDFLNFLVRCLSSTLFVYIFNLFTILSGVTEVPRLTRILALWSLSTSGMVKPQAVEPLFYSIFANPAEATEMRIAAFNILIKLNPPMAVFQKIATRTWIEQDMEVLKVVNSGK